jgi:hypothetical protein
LYLLFYLSWGTSIRGFWLKPGKNPPDHALKRHGLRRVSSVIWVTEVWSSAEAHQASLTLDGVKETIKRGRPLIAGGERIEIVSIGGKGLTTG